MGKWSSAPAAGGNQWSYHSHRPRAESVENHRKTRGKWKRTGADGGHRWSAYGHQPRAESVENHGKTIGKWKRAPAAGGGPAEVLQPPALGQQASGSRHRTAGIGHQASGTRHRTASIGQQASGSRHRTGGPAEGLQRQFLEQGKNPYAALRGIIFGEKT